MKKAPNIWELKELVEHAAYTQGLIGGKWLPVRPLGLDTLLSRITLAWNVFVGKYDAVKWPGGQ